MATLFGRAGAAHEGRRADALAFSQVRMQVYCMFCWRWIAKKAPACLAGLPWEVDAGRITREPDPEAGPESCLNSQFLGQAANDLKLFGKRRLNHASFGGT